MNNPELNVVFGTGPLGMATMHELVKRGKIVRLVNRSGQTPQGVPAGVTVVAGDVSEPAVARNLAQGASVVYQCLNVPYHQWPEKFPPLNKNILDAAISANAKLVVAENLYMYGDPNGQSLTEDLPYAAHTRKGRVRAAMAEEVMQAHRRGKVRAVIARASEFYGPGVLGSAVGERTFGFAVQGKAAEGNGNIDLPIKYSFVNDFGKALAILSEHDEADGQVWHVPSGEAVTTRRFIEMIFEELGRPPKISVMSKRMLLFLGLFIPVAREAVEMSYEFEKPFTIDASKFIRAFGDIATPHREAIKETVAWYKKNFKAS